MTSVTPPKTLPKHLRDDPYISGRIQTHAQGKCDNCNSHAFIIQVFSVSLPSGISPHRSMIAYRLDTPQDEPLEPVNRLGITCGCYARFHRQVTHILDKTRSSSK